MDRFSGAGSFKRPFEETIITENLLEIEQASQTLINQIFQAYIISHEKLEHEGLEAQNEKRLIQNYIGEKWGGKYLRSPESFLQILMNKKTDLSKICDLSSVRVQGYVHDNNIGEKYPKTLFIKTVKEAGKVLLEANDCYAYGVSDTASNREIAPILIARTFGEKHIILYNECGAVGKEFYRVYVDPDYCDPLSFCIFLNSSFFIMQRELMGLVGLGGGALKFSGYDIGKIYTLKNMPNLSQQKGAKDFISRKILSPILECGLDPERDTPIEEQEPQPLPDRKALDDVIFDALDLTAEERKDVYRAVCRLVWNRISKAKNK